MRPTACQPKKRLTRSRITADRCWISSAAGPSTRKHHCRRLRRRGTLPRGQLIFIGSLWAAISGPAISAQRAMSSAEAKPCALRPSLKVAAVNSDSGRGKLREGLFISGVILCHRRRHERSSPVAAAEESLGARSRRFVGLVRPPCSRAAVAGAPRRDGGPIPCLAVGDHAAADDGASGRALLCQVPGALADGRSARRGEPRRRAARLGRARLLRARAQSARLRQGGGRAARRNFPGGLRRAACVAGHRRLHRGGGRRDCVRRARRAGRRQCRARGDAAVCGRRRAAGGQARDQTASRVVACRRTALAISRRR